jgi:hypothetical protein
MVIGAALVSGANTGTGSVQLRPQTANKVVALGAADSSSQLGLTDTELDYVTTKTLRIGDYQGTNSGNFTVTGAITIADTKVGATAIRTTGTVTGAGTISTTNLGISAATVNLGGNNSVTGNLAISASGATVSFGQTLGTYTPASVDGISAEFGLLLTSSLKSSSS